MARAVIDTPFPSPKETADVLGVSVIRTRRLMDLAKETVAASRSRRSKAKANDKKTASRARRTSRR